MSTMLWNGWISGEFGSKYPLLFLLCIVYQDDEEGRERERVKECSKNLVFLLLDHDEHERAHKV